MEDTQRDFYKRQKQIQRKHQRLANGYVTRINKYGVIEHCPEARTSRGILRLLIVVAVALVGLKSLILYWQGEQAYTATLADLSVGTTLEQGGAWLMQIDPVTAQIVAFVSSIFG